MPHTWKILSLLWSVFILMGYQGAVKAAAAPLVIMPHVDLIEKVKSPGAIPLEELYIRIVTKGEKIHPIFDAPYQFPIGTGLYPNKTLKVDEEIEFSFSMTDKDIDTPIINNENTIGVVIVNAHDAPEVNCSWIIPPGSAVEKEGEKGNKAAFLITFNNEVYRLVLSVQIKTPKK